MRSVLIAGPPCSGKTTLAHYEAEQRGGMVLDWDETWTQITGRPMHDVDVSADGALMDQVEAQFRRQCNRTLGVGLRCWLVRSAPSPMTRVMLQQMYAVRSVVLAVPEAECMTRLETTERPYPEQTQRVVQQWWAQYQPRADDLTLNGWVLGTDPLEALLGSA